MPDEASNVLRVDGPTRDAIIELVREAAYPALARLIASRFPASAEPSPNQLREACERKAEAEAGRLRAALGQIAGEWHARRLPDGERYGCSCPEFAREALTTDQSQSDRTSDEATPGEPVYEWRAVSENGFAWRAHPTRRGAEHHLARRGPGWIERAVARGPWERVDDGGRRDG